MIVYPPRDIRPFVMYCVNGKPRSSLLIESTDSMIMHEKVFSIQKPYSGYFLWGKIFVDMENVVGSWKNFCGYVYACTNGRGSLHLW